MLTNLLVFVHVLAVFWLVAGMVGRNISYREAGRAEGLGTLQTLVRLGHIFEMTMLRPATFVVFFTGLIAAWLRGWPILGFLQGGQTNWVLAAVLVYLTLIPLIILVFLPKGKIYRKALDEAVEKGVVTTALRSAINDPAVGAGRSYEIVMVVVMAWLMIAKPF